uniref:Autophagy-related protein 14 n=1 Tax=Strongyloides papillosus TaxID=174720 RepID=A0A0N5BRA9_STREA
MEDSLSNDLFSNTSETKFYFRDLKNLYNKNSTTLGIMENSCFNDDEICGIIQKKDLVKNIDEIKCKEKFQIVKPKTTCIGCEKHAELYCWTCQYNSYEPLINLYNKTLKENETLQEELSSKIKKRMEIGSKISSTEMNISEIEKKIKEKKYSIYLLGKRKKQLEYAVEGRSKRIKDLKEKNNYANDYKLLLIKKVNKHEKQFNNSSKNISRRKCERIICLLSNIIPITKIQRYIESPVRSDSVVKMIKEAANDIIPLDYKALLSSNEKVAYDIYQVCGCEIPELDKYKNLKQQINNGIYSMNIEYKKQLAALNFLVLITETLVPLLNVILPFQFTLKTIMDCDSWDLEHFEGTWIKLNFVITLICLQASMPQEKIHFLKPMKNLVELKVYCNDCIKSGNLVLYPQAFSGKLKEKYCELFAENKKYTEEFADDWDLI